MIFELNIFEKEENRIQPKLFYRYKYNMGNYKYQMFTMNGGKTYFASIEYEGTRWFLEKTDNFETIDDCLEFFQGYYDENVKEKQKV